MWIPKSFSDATLQGSESAIVYRLIMDASDGENTLPGMATFYVYLSQSTGMDTDDIAVAMANGMIGCEFVNGGILTITAISSVARIEETITDVTP